MWICTIFFRGVSFLVISFVGKQIALEICSPNLRVVSFWESVFFFWPRKIEVAERIRNSYRFVFVTLWLPCSFSLCKRESSCKEFILTALFVWGRIRLRFIFLPSWDDEREKERLCVWELFPFNYLHLMKVLQWDLFSRHKLGVGQVNLILSFSSI